jgi:uncharacterized protein YutE (UPF0331/DUF86 family)
MVDKTLILKKLSNVEEYLKQIKEFSDISVKVYDANWKIQRIVERTLQIMIESCLDVAGHIISDAGFRVPETYVDMFRILTENGILKEKQLAALEKMARFRNIVVHDYAKIDLCRHYPIKIDWHFICKRWKNITHGKANILRC